MKVVPVLLAFSVVLACSTNGLLADEAAKGVPPAAPNAAVVYWQAFAAMPNLDADEKKILEAAASDVKSHLTDELVPLVRRYRTSLHELQRASEITPCDWQLDTNAGPLLLMTHLQKARDLGRVALLRARQSFAAGETERALDDVRASFKMARDCAASPSLISLTVEGAIEKLAGEVLAVNLPLLTKAQLKELNAMFRELPSSCSVVTAIHEESRYFCDWLARQIDTEVEKLGDSQARGDLFRAIMEIMGEESELNPSSNDAEGIRKAELLKSLTEADVRESLQRLRSDFAELEQIAALPFVERTVRIEAFEESLSASSRYVSREDALRYFSNSLLGIGRLAIARGDQQAVRRHLLEQAIRLQRDGANTALPIYGEKVEYQRTAAGFALRCLVGDTAETLTVGSAE